MSSSVIATNSPPFSSNVPGQIRLRIVFSSMHSIADSASPTAYRAPECSRPWCRPVVPEVNSPRSTSVTWRPRSVRSCAGPPPVPPPPTISTWNGWVPDALVIAASLPSGTPTRLPSARAWTRPPGPRRTSPRGARAPRTPPDPPRSRRRARRRARAPSTGPRRPSQCARPPGRPLAPAPRRSRRARAPFPSDLLRPVTVQVSPGSLRYSSQSIVRWTAFFQNPYSLSTSSFGSWGVHSLSFPQFARRSSTSFQNPTARPAAYADPSAVVSATCGRITGTPSTSAWNCISSSLKTMPPSALSEESSTPESAFMASTTSLDCQAVASSTARAMCPLLTYRVRPAITPRASLRQYGANRPENAGTKYAPPLSSTVAASASMSADFSIMPRLSRSHCTSAPVMAIDPSSMYTAGWSPILYPSPVISPLLLGTC